MFQVTEKIDRSEGKLTILVIVSTPEGPRRWEQTYSAAAGSIDRVEPRARNLAPLVTVRPKEMRR